MGCVQSLFNPSKSSPTSPEKEFVPPTFETVVVTRQPKKTKTNEGVGDEKDDDEVACKCDDFDRYATEENGDNRSVHYVEATAVRRLAADTSSVAILGTTAKCKSLCDSPPARRPLTKKQNTWPSAVAGNLPKKPPRLAVETRYVEATAVRTLAAETGSIAILGTTADPKPRQERETADGGETGSVHYVEATAVRTLAAETGTIAILASTAAAGASPSGDGRDDDPELMPVGVREVLDSEPGEVRGRKRERVLDGRPENGGELDENARTIGRGPQVPLPVVRAMGMKSGTPSLAPSSSEKRGLPPRSVTADGANPGGGSALEAFSRKPLVRQSNEACERDENDYLALIDGWTPTIPVFAKCPPAKAKSLPTKNSNLEGEPQKDDGQHGVVRGSSLPSETQIVGNEKPSNSTEHENREQVDEPVVVQPNAAAYAKSIETNAVQSITVERNSGRVELSTTAGSELAQPNELQPNGVKSSEDRKSAAVQPNVTNGNAAETNEIEQNVTRSLEPVEPEPGIGSDEPKETETVSHEVVTKTIRDEPNVERLGSRGPVGDELPSGKRATGPGVETKTGAENPSGDHQGTSGDGADVAADDEADAEYRLTMIQSVREAVNRICEQAVEKTAAMVKSGQTSRRDAVAAAQTIVRSDKRDPADDSEVSEFSLPPPPPAPGADSASIGQESSWPPPPQESEEERTIAPGFSFDLPDPPTDMDQMDSETDKMDISDEEMRATGLPSDEDDKTDTETGGDDRSHAMKSTIAPEPVANSMALAAAAVDDDGGGGGGGGGTNDRAATTIQAMYRGFRARKHVETVHAAAAKIQAGFRGYRVRQWLKNAAPSTATTTTDDSQCWSDDDQKSVVSVTGVPLKQLLPADQAAAAVASGGGSAVDAAALTKAAVKIQARVRGFAARKRLNEDRNGKQ